MKRLLELFKSPPQRKILPQKEHAQLFSFYRLRVFLGIFIGYAGYYLVRKNISLVMPDIERIYGYSKFEQGMILAATSFAYGISKFVMGWFSDRSNAKFFLAIGLIFSSAISCLLGFSPALFNYYYLLLCLMFLNGWFQGMGWPPCGRVMVHWFSPRERGAKMALWNMAHNIGQAFPAILLSMGLSVMFGWSSALYIPGLIALAISFLSFYLIQDTPGSVGLPSIESFKNEPVVYPNSEHEHLSVMEQLNKYIFKNKYLWFLGIANLFVYLTRYAIIDWLPSYLVEVRNFSTEKASFSYSIYELAGILGTFASGWISDRFFNARRAPAGVLFMILIAIVLNIYWFAPNSAVTLIDASLFMMGFLIYGPVMLIGLHALDLVPKHIAGTAAGFTGLFGYVGGATCANALFGWIVDVYGWNGGFILLLASCFFATFFLALAWNAGYTPGPRITEKKQPLKKRKYHLRHKLA